MQTVELRVRAGELVDDGSWLYAWCRETDRRVVYVGGTGLPPVVRTWLHLHDGDPDVARVRSRYGGWAVDELLVVAFRLDDSSSRSQAKAELIRRLSDAGLLADGYAGDPPGDVPAVGAHDEQVALLVEHLARRLEAPRLHDGTRPAT